MLNKKMVNMDMTRLEICDLMTACSSAYRRTDAEKWKNLHEHLKEILDKFDEEQGYKVP